MSSSTNKSEDNPANWVHFFQGEPNFEELKHALFVDLYKQFGVNAEVIHKNDRPVLKAEINYKGQTPNLPGNLEALHRIYDINLTMRTLSLVRGLDYLYRKLHNIDQPDRHLNILMSDYGDFLGLLNELHEDNRSKPIENYPQKIEHLEAKFHAKLAAFLKKYLLDETGFTLEKRDSQKQYAKLLSHIRYVSSVLDPALGMEVVYNDLKHKSKVTYNITPITKKTKTQKKLINDQKDPQNFIDWVSIQFNPLLVQDNTQLPALTRYTHLQTLKNGFIVTGCYEIDGKEKTWWYTRSATLAYVGKDCTENQLAQSFQENVAQIRLNLRANGISDDEHSPIEILMLTTDFVVDANVEIKATRRTKQYINPENTPNVKLSEMPINFIGTTLYKGKIDGENAPRTFGNKRERAEQAAMHVYEQLHNEKHLHLHCASGIDRTTMIDTKANIWMEHGVLYDLTGTDMDLAEIERKYCLGLIGPMIAHLIRNGSMGLKPKTKTSNWQGLGVPLKVMRKVGLNPTDDLFSEETNRLFYWDIANTNRERPIDDSSFHRLLDAKTVDSKTDSLGSSEDSLEVRAKKAAINLLDDPLDESALYEYYDMLSEVEEAGPDYTKLYVVLLTILCLISIAIGIVCLIPTGGSSALVSLCACIGLALTLEYSTCCLIGACAIAGGLVSGLAALYMHFKKPKDDPDDDPEDSALTDYELVSSYAEETEDENEDTTILTQ